MDDIVFDYCLSTFVPILVYWIFDGVYTLLGKVDNYRLHTTEEVDLKNFVTRKQVYTGAVLQQICQATVSMTLFLLGDDRVAAAGKRGKPWAVIGAQFVIALFVLDGTQFFIHIFLHKNKYLYRVLHSWHHRLIAPFAAGTQYNQPIDGLLVETLPGILAYLASGMSPRTSAAFYSFAFVKAMDDHSGLWIPWNPFHALLKNNVAYHEIHHRMGVYNHGQTVLTVWDKMFGTFMDYNVVKREGGGYEVRMAKDFLVD